jgi:hypothetical protein
MFSTYLSCMTKININWAVVYIVRGFQLGKDVKEISSGLFPDITNSLSVWEDDKMNHKFRLWFACPARKVRH